MSEETLGAALEAVIFLSDKPQSLTQIRDAIDPILPLKVLHEALQLLQSEYERPHHGIRIVEVAQGYQFRTKATYQKVVVNHLKITPATLSPGALEVLAIICFQQPISKPILDQIRGVDSGHLLRILLDRRLVAVMGKSEDEPGKPSIYGTTKEFLEFFELPSLDQMPKFEELQELAISQAHKDLPKLDEVLNQDQKNRFYFDELKELDELSAQLKNIPTDTEFTKVLRSDKAQMEYIQQTLKDVTDSEVQEVVDSAALSEESGAPTAAPVKRLSAFELLEHFTAQPDPVEQLEAIPETSIEIPLETPLATSTGEDDLEALLDLAFEKLRKAAGPSQAE